MGLACGPDGEQAPDTDSEGETESEESGSTGNTNPTTTNSTVGTSSATGTTSTTGPAPTTTTGPDPDTATSDPPPPETDTGECPYGTEGCLCDVGAACDEGLDCNDEGICVAPPACEPIDTDPHGDEASAISLDPLDCGMGGDLGLVGTVAGPETDWYSFVGNEAFGCPEQPGAAVVAADPLEVCVFLECTNGGDVDPLDCAAGSTDATSPDGRPGCCGDGAAMVEGYDCTGFGGKDVDVWISVGSDQQICADYELSYGY